MLASPVDAAVFTTLPFPVRIQYNFLIIVDFPVPACPKMKTLCPKKAAENISSKTFIFFFFFFFFLLYMFTEFLRRF